MNPMLITSILQAAPGFLGGFSGAAGIEATNADIAAEQRRRWIFGGVIFGGLILTALLLAPRK